MHIMANCKHKCFAEFVMLECFHSSTTNLLVEAIGTVPCVYKWNVIVNRFFFMNKAVSSVFSAAIQLL